MGVNERKDVTPGVDHDIFTGAELDSKPVRKQKEQAEVKIVQPAFVAQNLKKGGKK